MIKSIEPEKFFEWSRTYQFRQSSTDDRVLKNSVVPNYSGFLPQINSSGLHGLNKSALSRQGKCCVNTQTVHQC